MNIYSPQGEPDHRPPLLNLPFVWLIRLYQKVVSPALGTNCRFTPTCSQYAVDCLHAHTLPVAIAKSTWRVLRCNPLIPGGHDPVIGSKSTPCQCEQEGNG